MLIGLVGAGFFALGSYQLGIIGALLVLCWTTGVATTVYGKALSLGAIVFEVVVLNDVREEHRLKLVNI